MKPTLLRRGFTLIELLMIISIIGILIALLLPAVQRARAAAHRIQCVNNLKQIGLGLHNYHTAIRKFPYGTNGCCSNAGGNWTTMLLPYLEQTALYNQINFKGNLKDAAHATVVKTVIPAFMCPADPESGRPIMERYSHNATPEMALWYPASMGPIHMDSCPFSPDPTPSQGNFSCQGYNFGTTAGGGSPANFSVGAFGRNTVSTRIADIRDGTSNTFMVGETLPGHCTFMGVFAHNFPLSGTSIPLNIMESANGTNWYRTCGFKSLHGGGANFAMCDGSVHFVSQYIDYRLYNNLGTIRGGEVVSLPQ